MYNWRYLYISFLSISFFNFCQDFLGIRTGYFPEMVVHVMISWLLPVSLRSSWRHFHILYRIYIKGSIWVSNLWRLPVLFIVLLIISGRFRNTIQKFVHTWSHSWGRTHMIEKTDLKKIGSPATILLFGRILVL